MKGKIRKLFKRVKEYFDVMQAKMENNESEAEPANKRNGRQRK
jgi:hypothetical protein